MCMGFAMFRELFDDEQKCVLPELNGHVLWNSFWFSHDHMAVTWGYGEEIEVQAFPDGALHLSIRGEEEFHIYHPDRAQDLINDKHFGQLYH